MLVFEERRYRSTRRKNLSEQRREPTTNSTHIWHWRQDMNPGHIGGRGEQYFYPPMLALFAYLNTLICLFLFRNIQHPDHVRDDNYYVWTFCRLISVRSLFWSNLKLLKGRQTPVTFRNMETWSVNLIIFEIFICWWKTGWLNRCHNCVHIDVQSPIIEGEHGSSTLKGDSHFFFQKSLEVLFQVHVPPQKSSVHSVLKCCLSLWWDFLSSQ